MSPLVSIIVTSYNYERYITQTIQSVLEQTLREWELIVADDGSADRSVEVIRSFRDARIKLLISERNEGACVAYNKAYNCARGKYVLSLDSDDFIPVENLARKVEFLEHHPHVDILGSYVFEVDTEGQRTGGKYPYESWFNQDLNFNTAESWIWQNHLCHSSVLMRKELHDKVGKFNEDLVYTPDYEFWLRCLHHGGRFHVLPEPLVYCRAHDRNLTGKDPVRFLEEFGYEYCRYLKPLLHQTTGRGLAKQANAVSKFLDHAAFRTFSGAKQENLLKNLLLEDPFQGSFLEFERQLESPASRSPSKLVTAVVLGLRQEIEEAKAYTQELLKAKQWLEEQVASWNSTASRLESSLQALSSHSKEQEEYFVKLQEAKSWLEQQVVNWKSTASRLESDVQALTSRSKERDGYFVKLQEGKGWLEEQYETWRGVATDRERMIRELKNYISSLEEKERDGAKRLEAAQAELGSKTHMIARWNKSVWGRIGSFFGSFGDTK